jgi:hypothetical protein
MCPGARRGAADARWIADGSGESSEWREEIDEMQEANPKLHPLAEGLWTTEHALRVAGLALGTRTTIARLADGGLWVHSPGPLDERLAGEVRALGPVRSLVAPNLFHHLYVSDWQAMFPDARTLAVPGLAEKQRALHIDETLAREPLAAWSGVIEQLQMEGVPSLAEVVFLHVPSRTLVLTDLCFNMHHSNSRWTRIALRLNAAWRRFAPSRLFRLFIKDESALRAGIERILEWDFDRVVVAHGDVLESGGRDALRAAYRWMGVGRG